MSLQPQVSNKRFWQCLALCLFTTVPVVTYVQRKAAAQSVSPYPPSPVRIEGVAERLSPEQFVGPLTSEERRQVVKEAKSRGFSQTVLIGAQVCAECHQDVVAQWAVSAHRFSSFNNPFYEASIEDLRRAPRGQIRARWCASCHDPALLLTGDFNPGFDRNGAQAQAGLTCLACHGIRDIAGRPGNGNYVMGPGLLGANDPLLSPDRKLHIGDPEAVKLHKQNVLTRRHQSAEFCGACHKASIPEEVNNYHWFRAQNDYDAWHDSGISGNAARSFITQDVTKDCRACHMPLEDAPLGDLAAKNGKVRSHRFLAVNTALPALRGDMESVNRIKEFLSGRVSIDLSTVQRGVNFDEYIPLPDVTRPVLIAGEEVQLDVVVRNRDVGHTFPGGTLDLNEGWVELSLLGPDGELLAVSGDRGKDERLDPEAHAYSALFLNDSGKPITRHNVADIRTPVWRHVIPYGEADLIRYRFKIPRQLAGKLITFRGRLLLRKFNEPFLRFSETNVKGFRGRKLTLPIIELASSETSLAVSDRPSDARAPDLLKIHPEHWGRLNDYGIAALLQRDFDAAEYAFLQVQKLAPGTTEGLLNYARTMIEEGNTVEGLKALDRLTSLIPEDPRLSWSFGQAYFMRREYELAAKAFRNVVRLRPSDRQSWGMLGHSLMIQGDSEKALTALDKVLEIDPVNEWANFFKASALRDLKRDSEASRYSAAYEKYKEDYYARNRQWRHREKSPIDHREAYPFHWHVLRYIDN